MSKIAFPIMGDYALIAEYFFKNATDVEIIKTSKITTKTIEIGNKYSPSFVCMPFKYTLGSLKEALDLGADTLLQLGGGCRYGYYFELQEKILKDLGYKFKMINFVTEGKTDFKRIKSEFSKIKTKTSLYKIIKYTILTRKMIKYFDNIDEIIRTKIGFEKEEGSFIKLKNNIQKDLLKSKSLITLYIRYKNAVKKLNKIEINKPSNALKIGIIGELYTVMEPFSNYFLEKDLAKHNIEIKRFTNVNYLLFKKGKYEKKHLKNVSKYVKYKMGADAMDNISWTKYLAENKYDGIIHIKSSFCTPEIGAMPIINKIAKKYNIPIIFLSFDSNTSEVGIKTRLEAFYDMIEMRKTSGMLFRN